MTLSGILLVVLLVLLIAAIPSWPYSQGWGYGPSGGLAALLLIVLVVLFFGRH